MLIHQRSVDLIPSSIVQREMLINLPTVLPVEVVFVGPGDDLAPTTLQITVRNSKKKICSRVSGTVDPSPEEIELAIVLSEVRVIHVITFPVKSELHRMLADDLRETISYLIGLVKAWLRTKR